MNDAEAEITPLWRFSLRFYRRTGIADAAIALQDECGIDVNLLLFLLWLAAEGRLLSAAEVKQLDDEISAWRDLAIVPLRGLRRELKAMPGRIDGAAQEAFRSKIKAAELEAERLEQNALYAFAQAAPLGGAAAPAAAARANVVAYEEVMGASFPKPAVALLLATFERFEQSGL
jgi:uncharacterized protein (TIGR02444 family)